MVHAHVMMMVAGGMGVARRCSGDRQGSRDSGKQRKLDERFHNGLQFLGHMVRRQRRSIARGSACRRPGSPFSPHFSDI